jgi:hypothetical protein
MLLMSPPEGVLLQQLILLELLPHSPSLIICQGKSVLLEKSVDTRNTMVPTLLQIIKSQPPVLCLCLLSLDGILGPDSLTIDEL